ncbi:calcium/calmodulin-dependent protein kinase kinase 1-like isoform X2 [Paramacrobiotus metropolitanus]|nr:calcium/calmodulin-dependent protein kinase kinase 1-like isoform X2 [Paramacrobiotus metropolitanus]
MAFEAPVSYTEEDLCNLQKEIIVDEAVAATVLQEQPDSLSTGFLPPCLLQKIVDATEDIDGLNPDTAVKAFQPLLRTNLSTSLSVTSEGFIQMNDYKISFDSMGGGRLSEVRVAFNEKDGQHYAVKILSRRKMQCYNKLLRSSRNPLAETYREIDVLRKLDHPNIIQLVEVVDNPTDDNIYIVTELLDQALMDLPTESPFPESEARNYFQEILDGVDYLHSQKVVHRDLKPDNMLLSKQGRVKIADFGFCEEGGSDTEDSTGTESDTSNSDAVNEPEVSAVHGTPAFTPPECLRTTNKPVSGYALDMWSLGVTLYALIVGDVPFKGDSMPQLFKAILNDSVEFPADADISPELKDLLARLLTKNPKRRIRMEDVKLHPWLQTDNHAPGGDVGSGDDCKNGALSSVIERKGSHHLRS